MRRNNDLRGRLAGQSAMAAVIEAQSHRGPRGRLARLVGVSPLTAEGKIHYSGAVGELLVGSILDRLGHSWDVLHGVPMGASSLDHFVVGPAGVFAVVVVNCQGDEVSINGDELTVAKHPHGGIVHARMAAAIVSDSLSRALSTPVTVAAAVVVVDPTKLSTLQAPDGVHVLTSTQLEPWLLSSPTLLSGVQVADISGAADGDETWPQLEREASLSAHNLTGTFVEIHYDVRSATVRRFLWIAAALGVTILSVWVLVSILASVVVQSR